MRRDNKINIKYLAIVVILIIFHYLGILRPFEMVVTKVVNPVLSSFYGLGSSIREIFKADTEKKTLQTENRELKDELKLLTEEAANMKVLEDENKSLREHLNFLKTSENKYVLSNVVSQGDIDSSNDLVESFVLDKGSNDGVVAGLAVVSGTGAVVGKVSQVKENSSVAFLVNNSRCRLAASIFGSDKTNGIIEGELGLTTKMKFIPLSKKINVGDLVVTSGLEPSIPKGLVIGRVSEVKKENNEIWQEAVVTPIDSIEYLSVASIILK